MWTVIANLAFLPVFAQAGAGVGSTLPDADVAPTKPIFAYSVRDAREQRARDVVILADASIAVTERTCAPGGGVVAHTAKGTLAHDAMDEIRGLPDAADANAANALARRIDLLVDRMLEKEKAKAGAHAKARAGGVVGRPRPTRPADGTLIGLPGPKILPGLPATGVRR